MYKITRVVELKRTPLESMAQRITKYINEELKEDEFLLHVEYFKDNGEFSVTPIIAYLHIAKLIQ